MANPIQDSLLREIDEELRQEHYAKLWKTYGHYVVIAAVAMVVVVAGYQGWRSYDLSSRRADGERFAAAERLALANDVEASRRAFAGLAAEGRAGYALLARLQEASLLAREGKSDEAVTAYRAIAADTDLESIYRDLAVVLEAMLELDTADPAQLRERLAPLTADGNPWRHSAREMTALLAERQGDRAAAKTLLGGLVNDTSAPRGIRTRATEMLTRLDG